ncbi:hypothetical protein ABLN87_11985 [Ruegeria sp. SCPT10]|uniref:hypothetical protein n=1 Tax=Ruegeria sp. SCP10 TaxID=3141377 RepID=UPI00333926D7
MIGILDNKIAAALLPLLPVMLAAVFKFSVIDDVNGDPYLHIFSNYVVGAWIDVLSISLIGAIAWAYASAGHERFIAKELAIIVAAPMLTLVVCVFFRLGAPKMNWNGDLYVVYIPLCLSLFSLAFSSVMIRELSK